jgi:hypothetical protein
MCKYDRQSERDTYDYCATDCLLEAVKVENYLQNLVSNMWVMLRTFYIIEYSCLIHSLTTSPTY